MNEKYFCLISVGEIMDRKKTVFLPSMEKSLEIGGFSATESERNAQKMNGVQQSSEIKEGLILRLQYSKVPIAVTISVRQSRMFTRSDQNWFKC